MSRPECGPLESIDPVNKLSIGAVALALFGAGPASAAEVMAT